MKYDVYYRLFREAQEIKSFDFFVGERGWQDWMDDYDGDSDKIVKVLETIYQQARGVKEMRELTGMTQAEFGRHFGIPKRSIGNWETGDRPPLEYLLPLMGYALFMDGEEV